MTNDAKIKVKLKSIPSDFIVTEIPKTPEPTAPSTKTVEPPPTDAEKSSIRKIHEDFVNQQQINQQVRGKLISEETKKPKFSIPEFASFSKPLRKFTYQLFLKTHPDLDITTDGALTLSKTYKFLTNQLKFSKLDAQKYLLFLQNETDLTLEIKCSTDKNIRKQVFNYLSKYKKILKLRTGNGFYSLRKLAKRSEKVYYMSMIVRKSNMNHVKMINHMAEFFKVEKKTFTWAGMKDKRAVTSQQLVLQHNGELNKINFKKFKYPVQIFKKDEIVDSDDSKNNGTKNDSSENDSSKNDDSKTADSEKIHSKDSAENNVPEFLELVKVEETNGPLVLSHHQGNEFEIILRKTEETAEDFDVMNNFSNKYVNYFGEQRTGTESHNTVKIGELLVKKEYAEAVKLLELSNKKLTEFDNHSATKILLENLSYYQRLFYMHAFSSDVWNRVAEKHKNNPEIIELPMIGSKLVEYFKDFDEVIKNDYVEILSEKGIHIGNSNFKYSEINLKLPGCMRKLHIKVENLEHQHIENGIKFKFKLPPGSYATTYLSNFFIF